MKVFSPLLLMVFLVLCCQKDEVSPIELEEVYEQHFYCNLNGHPYIDTTSSNYKMKYRGYFDKEVDQLRFFTELSYLSKADRWEPSVRFWLKLDPVRLGLRNIKTHSYQDHITMLDDYWCGKYFIVTSEPHLIEMVELDEENQIVKGNFSFTARNNCQDTLIVTDGYFDIQYVLD